MKFGVHFLLSCPEHLTTSQVYAEALQQATASESLGFESVWPVEQHSHQRLSVLPSPCIFLAAVAARTKTLRLGTAIVQLPLSHPLRIAEDIATLDQLSAGRVELGVARGAIPAHYASFGIPMREGRARMVEALAYLKTAFTGHPFSLTGQYYPADNVCLIPKPVQQPYPPIRIAANSPETLEFAAREGFPVLLAAHLNPVPRLAKLLPRYHALRAEGVGAATPDDISILMPCYIDDSEGDVRRWAEPAMRAHLDLVAGNLVAAASAAPTDAARAALDQAMQRLRATTYEEMRASMALFETPKGCLDRLSAMRESLNPGRIICWFNFMGMIPHEQVLKSMKLFASEVLPHA